MTASSTTTTSTSQPFHPLFPPTPHRPPSSQHLGRTSGTILHGYIRNNFTITTWLLLGSLLQCLILTILPLRYAALPPLLTLLLRTTDHLLMQLGITQNRYMTNDIITQKFSAQIPDPATGAFGTRPSNSGIVVFLLTARSNGPLGILDPDMATMGRYLTKMNASLETCPRKYGFLGSSNWLNNSDRGTAGEIMNVMYFQTLAGLHAFAEDAIHKEGWKWWHEGFVKRERKRHLGIGHEVFEVREGGWEGVWMNYHRSGLAGGMFPVGVGMKEKKEKKEGGGEEGEERVQGWQSPVVDAGRGVLGSSKGRMGRL